MLTRERIIEAVRTAALEYPVKAVHLFGSYADGTATERSDVDLYVEFSQAPVSFFKVMGFRGRLEELLEKDVDVVKHRPEEGMLVCIYEA